MKRHLRNAAFGFLDYAAYPVGMLLIAPLMIRQLGPAHFGIWAFGMAFINTGSIVASGFGDANIQQIATARATSDRIHIERSIRATVSIHLALGALLSTIGFLTAPFMAQHVAIHSDVAMCTASLRLASMCILFRALETVAVSSYRAYERYFDAVRVSATGRIASLAVAGILASQRTSTTVIFLSAAVIQGLATAAQLASLTQLVPPSSLIPTVRELRTERMLKFGAFTWIQAVCTALFSQMDRLYVGMVFGAISVGAYSLCVQIAQPISGATASALHFLFPALAHNNSTGDRRLATAVAVAIACNVGFVIVASLALAVAGSYLLSVWTSPSIAAIANSILPWCVIGSACAALAIAGTYALLAFGKAGTAVGTTVVSGVAMLATLLALQHPFGLKGVAISRVAFGLTSLFVYIPVVRVLRSGSSTDAGVVLSLTHVEEGL